MLQNHPIARGSCLALLLCCLAALVALPGCSGCSSDPAAVSDAEKEKERKKKEEEERRRREEEAKKKPFEKSLMRVLPYDDINLLAGVKQGHWISVSQTIKSNEADFNGQLAFTPINKQSSPIDLPDTPYYMNLSRPINLPKGQAKQIDMTLFAPRTAGNSRMRGGLISTVGREVEPAIEEFRSIPAHAYYFVVLCNQPEQYGNLQTMHFARAPSGSSMQDDTYYHVIRPDLEKGVPLADSMLTWTGVAYVLWDKVDPALLSLEQQQAMLDWLHWGGQLIVSGPETLDLLRGSFLAAYLPATGGESIEFTADDLEELSDQFSPRPKKGPPKKLVVGRPWSGIDLQLADLPGEQIGVLIDTPQGKPLLVERRVGRGRIAVTAFRMRQADLINWAGFDSLLNACLLRRGPREYRLVGGAFNQPQLDWHQIGGRRRDPRLISDFRLFSRDAGYSFRKERDQVDETGAAVFGEVSSTPSLGAWTDSNDVANAARDTLTEAAGIEIPDADFVVKVLAIYLVIIVPVNWLFFRLIGRVEWAWVAAVVIALAYAGLVIRMAQLDIGFARSKTELAVLELQPGYDRAHLTRYIALYTSLSSEYDLALNDRHALAQPFAIEQDFVRQPGDVSREVRYHQDKVAELMGYPVQSNRTGLVHGEQMFDLGGPFAYTPGVTSAVPGNVTNNSSRDIKQVAVIRHDGGSQRSIAWIGDLPTGATRGVRFTRVSANNVPAWYQEQSLTETAEETDSESLNLIRLIDVCLKSGEFEQQGVRLVGVMDDPDQLGISGIEFSPASRQSRYGTVILAHLNYGSKPTPQRDANSPDDVEIKQVVPQFNFGPEAIP